MNEKKRKKLAKLCDESQKITVSCIYQNVNYTVYAMVGMEIRTQQFTITNKRSTDFVMLASHKNYTFIFM